MAVCVSRASAVKVLPARSPRESSNGIVTPISLVALLWPSSVVRTVFLTPGDGGVMAAGGEDVDWAARLVDGALQGLAVDGQRRVVVPVGCEPRPQRGIELLGRDLHDGVAQTVDARSLVDAVDPAAAEVTQHRRREVAHPLVDGLVASGAAQRGRRSESQQGLEAVAAPVAAARVGEGAKHLGQALHLLGAQQGSRSPMTVAGLQNGAAQHAPSVTRESSIASPVPPRPGARTSTATRAESSPDTGFALKSSSVSQNKNLPWRGEQQFSFWRLTSP